MYYLLVIFEGKTCVAPDDKPILPFYHIELRGVGLLILRSLNLEHWKAFLPSGCGLGGGEGVGSEGSFLFTFNLSAFTWRSLRL